MGCLQVILSTKEGATLSGNTLPVSYSKFTSMVQKGDTIFLGRYLVTGSEESSCYLTVRCCCIPCTQPPMRESCCLTLCNPIMGSALHACKESCINSFWVTLCTHGALL